MRTWQLTIVFLPGKPRGLRSLEGYRTWGRNEWDTSDVTEHAHMHAPCYQLNSRLESKFIILSTVFCLFHDTLQNPILHLLVISFPICDSIQSFLPFIIFSLLKSTNLLLCTVSFNLSSKFSHDQNEFIHVCQEYQRNDISWYFPGHHNQRVHDINKSYY